VAIGKAKPVLSVLVKDDEGRLAFRNMQWGINWQYTDEKTGKTQAYELINSTTEKVFFVHKEQIFKQRCLIPIDGYWEFFHFSGQVYPYFLHPVEEGVFYAAGVCSKQVDTETGEVISAFSILTIPPNELARKLHNNPRSPNGSRMLLLLPKDQVNDYLNPSAGKEDLKKLFRPLPHQQMDAYPTPRFLKREFADKLDSPAVRERIDYPELFFA
jgi:putative SOS response-associated peptidase YedK